MTSLINNIFSNLNNLTKKPELQHQTKKNTNSVNVSPALAQGEKFKMYQTKIGKKLEKNVFALLFKKVEKEGFQNSLTSQTNSILQKNDYSSDNKNVDNLKKEYQSTLDEYKNTIEKIQSSRKNYLDRVNPNNPYLGKNACLPNGSCGYVTQKGVFKLYPDINTYNATAGKNGCPKTGYMQINGDGDVNAIGSTITSTPPLLVGTPMVSGQSCGNEGSTVFVDRLITDPSVSYIGCYADNTTSPLMTFIGGSEEGTYTYDQCKEAAINNGYRYFALQGVDYTTSKGYCAAGNNQTTATSLGNSYIINGQPVLWSSGTTGDNQGSLAMLNGDGTLVVNNTSGVTIFTTPVPESVKSQPNPYIGCYTLGDSSKDYEIAQRYSLTFEQCQDLATDKGYQYFGVGGNNRSDNVKRCLGYNDLKTAQSNGLSQKCKNQTTGGTSAASIYATDNLSTLGNSYLILQDDGNMCIYNGTGPSNNQGLIWSSGTNGKQLAANPQYAAAKGKYGKNWILNGSTMAAGDFVGSTNGNLALIMQTDGNLVLYTFTQTTNCQKMADGNTGAGIGGNALYDIGKAGNLADLSKTAYIDQDAKLHDINEGFTTMPDETSNIDSNTYDNYIYTDNPANQDGLKNANNAQKEKIAQLQSKLQSLSNKLSSYTGNYKTDLAQVQAQSAANVTGTQDYLNELQRVNNKMKHFDTNVENILNDSDITVLQKNYDYLFWSILATGTVLVAINTIRK